MGVAMTKSLATVPLLGSASCGAASELFLKRGDDSKSVTSFSYSMLP